MQKGSHRVLQADLHRLFLAAVLAAAGFLFSSAGPALAEDGLVYSVGECHEPASGGTDCTDFPIGLGGSPRIAVSPDGASVYVMGSLQILQFDRDTGSGDLSFAECYTKSATTGCTTVGEIDSAKEIEVSFDGASVYVGAADSVVQFDRDAETGDLSVAGEASIGDDADDIALSSDNKSLYAVSRGLDRLYRFDRSTAPETLGDLTQAQCIGNASGGGCGFSTGYYDAPSAVAVSADGTAVYVVSENSQTLIQHNHQSSGFIIYSECEATKDAGTLPDCDSVNNLDRVLLAAVAPDHGDIYTGTPIGSRANLAVFDHNTGTGQVTYPVGSNCFGSGTNCASVPKFSGPSSIEVAADGESVGAASSGVHFFDRAASGNLSLAACFEAPEGGTSCTDVPGMGTTTDVAFTPDGTSAVAITVDDVIFDFNRAPFDPPDTAIDTAVPDPTSDQTPSVEFSASKEGSTFECRVVPAGFAACTSPHTTETLGEGEHTFEVRATKDGQTDPTPAAQTFTVDLTPPETTIDADPGSLATGSPTFEFSSSEELSTYGCSVVPLGSPATFAPCSGPGATHTPSPALSDGDFRFEVRATDAAGNTDDSPAGHDFTVDATPPDTVIDSAPADPTADPASAFEFSSAAGDLNGFECSLDGDPFASCTSPFDAGDLEDGAHVFTVRALDLAGNADPTPAATSWTIDTEPPDTTIDSGPGESESTADESPSFSFSSPDGTAGFECSLDEEPFAPCTSPAANGPLGDGSHSFRVRAVDGTGNADPTPATRNFTVTAAACAEATTALEAATAEVAKRQKPVTRQKKKVKQAKKKLKKAKKRKLPLRVALAKRKLKQQKKKLRQLKKPLKEAVAARKAAAAAVEQLCRVPG